MTGKIYSAFAAGLRYKTNMDRLDAYFTPVALSESVTAGVITKVTLNQAPVILIRHQNTVHAYHDFCPHRGAPLSAGKIHNAQIHCPYHGWAFDPATGANTNVPVKNQPVACKLDPLFVTEKYGAIWLSKSAEAKLPVSAQYSDQIHFAGAIRSQLANVLENFLEGSHTHYVHDGLVRTQDKPRSNIPARFIPQPDGFEVHYGAEQQQGLVTRLAPKRFRELSTIAKYIYPYTAILQFYDRNKTLAAQFTGFLKPDKDSVQYFARVYISLGAFTPIAAWLGKSLFQKIVNQDKAILELQQANLEANRGRPFVSDDTTDLVGKQIFAWLHHPAQILSEERVMELHL